MREPTEMCPHSCVLLGRNVGMVPGTSARFARQYMSKREPELVPMQTPFASGTKKIRPFRFLVCLCSVGLGWGLLFFLLLLFFVFEFVVFPGAVIQRSDGGVARVENDFVMIGIETGVAK